MPTGGEIFATAGPAHGGDFAQFYRPQGKEPTEFEIQPGWSQLIGKKESLIDRFQYGVPSVLMAGR